jgi:hypothetical protein
LTGKAVEIFQMRKLWLSTLRLLQAQQLIVQAETKQSESLRIFPNEDEVEKKHWSTFVIRPWPRKWLVAESTPRTPGFVAYVGFLADKFVLGEVFLRVFRFFVSVTIPWMFHILFNSSREWQSV